MKHEVIDPGMAQVLEGLCDVPSPDPRRQAALRAEYLAQAHRLRAQTAVRRRARRVSWWPFAPSTRPRTAVRRLAQIAAVLLLVVATGSAGLAYAADEAVPGEALYPLDLALESARLGVTTRPGATVQVLLAHASERLSEAEALTAGGDDGHLGIAWNGYGAAISPLMHAVEAVVGHGEGVSVDRVNDALAAHEARWATILAAPRQPGTYSRLVATPAADPCLAGSLGETAAHIAWHYGIAYDDVASWMCAGGYGPGEVLLAIEIGRAAGVPAGEMLAHRQAGKQWGHIYREYADDAAGRQEPGPQDDAGSPHGEQPGDERATPGHGERHGQDPTAEHGPLPEQTRDPHGNKPEDASNSPGAGTATPRGTAEDEGMPDTGTAGGRDDTRPGGPGKGGGSKGGTPAPDGPGKGGGSNSATPTPTVPGNGDSKGNTPTPGGDGSQHGTPAAPGGGQPGNGNGSGEGKAPHEPAASAGPSNGTGPSAEADPVPAFVATPRPGTSEGHGRQ